LVVDDEGELKILAIDLGCVVGGEFTALPSMARVLLLDIYSLID